MRNNKYSNANFIISTTMRNGQYMIEMRIKEADKYHINSDATYIYQVSYNFRQALHNRQTKKEELWLLLYTITA